ncbi:hypothetical protein AVEN_214109-1 [Araneus ventricosus]|uniref:Uncharacterized protein n=1 Tax=Araneus ventricosus TaxID=182803 RepID=A0A4Y2C9M5_ARAVE|nr:hypothetical protein AVEN_214109-1 [Araneus ventricosus]
MYPNHKTLEALVENTLQFTNTVFFQKRGSVAACIVLFICKAKCFVPTKHVAEGEKEMSRVTPCVATLNPQTKQQTDLLCFFVGKPFIRIFQPPSRIFHSLLLPPPRNPDEGIPIFELQKKKK